MSLNFKIKYDEEKTLLSHYNKNTKYSSPINRDEFVLEISKFVKNIEGCKILDIGCGSGYLLSYLDSFDHKYTYVGIDYSEERIKYAKDLHKDKGNASFLLKDINYLEDIESSFDIIFSIEFFEHLKDPSSIISKSKKMLSKNGFIIGSIPINFPYYAHLQVFNSVKDAKERLGFGEYSEFSINKRKFLICKWTNS